LLEPWGWEASFAAGLMFPVVGALADIRRSGRIHPAWHCGMATMIGAFVLIEALTYSPLGTSIYAAVTRGSPGASVPGLDCAPPPSGPLMTGRG
jgi:hypothetical protein